MSVPSNQTMTNSVHPRQDRIAEIMELIHDLNLAGALDEDEGTNKPLGNLDPNVYATKKTIAQGLLDVALLTANASQLKYLLQVGKEHEFYYVMMVLISFSIILQIAIGLVIMLKGRYNINEEAQQASADFLNNALVWLIFASTIIHVFLSVFSIEPPPQPPITETSSSSTPDLDTSSNT